MLTLRIARLEDFEFAFNAKKQALGPYITQLWGWDERLQRKFHREEFILDEVQIILIEEIKVGYVRSRIEDGFFHVLQLFILPEYQSKGVGTFLMEGWLEKYPRIELEVLVINKRAQAFYKRLGFRVEWENEERVRLKWEK